MHHHQGFNDRVYWVNDSTGETRWEPPDGTDRMDWDRGVDGRIARNHNAGGDSSLLLMPGRES